MTERQKHHREAALKNLAKASASMASAEARTELAALAAWSASATAYATIAATHLALSNQNDD